MKVGTAVIAALALVYSGSIERRAKDKRSTAKRHAGKYAVRTLCLKERGVSGIGSIFGSIGVQHVNSNEKCARNIAPHG